MVKPGGTGSPIRHISARLAPLPPSSGFMLPLPSVLAPNMYTYFAPLPVVFTLALLFACAPAAFFLAINTVSLLRPPPERSPKCLQYRQSSPAGAPPMRAARFEASRHRPSPARRRRTGQPDPSGPQSLETPACSRISRRPHEFSVQSPRVSEAGQLPPAPQHAGVDRRTKRHAFCDVLHPLEQLGDRLQRQRAAHLRQRFELLPGFDHVEPLERLGDDGPDVSHVEAALFEQIDDALTQEGTQRLLGFLRRCPGRRGPDDQVPELDARGDARQFRKIRKNLHRALRLPSQTERIAGAGRPLARSEHSCNR